MDCGFMPLEEAEEGEEGRCWEDGIEELGVTSTTRGSWCTNLYLRPGLLGVKPHSRSTIRPATPWLIQTLQSMIHITSPFASRYPLLMFLIFGFGPRLWISPSRPERLGSSSSTRIFASKVENSVSSRWRTGYAGSSRDAMQK